MTLRDPLHIMLQGDLKKMIKSGGGQRLKMTSAYYVKKKLSLKVNYPKMMENAYKKQHFLRLLDKNA